jgi:hypothetical protein
MWKGFIWLRKECSNGMCQNFNVTSKKIIFIATDVIKKKELIGKKGNEEPRNTDENKDGKILVRNKEDRIKEEIQGIHKRMVRYQK